MGECLSIRSGFRACVLGAVLIHVAPAASWTDQERGAPVLKIFKVQGTARSAGLAGAGLARSAPGELNWNPLAAAEDSAPAVVFHELRFPERVGASFSQVALSQPSGDWRWILGGALLSWDDLQGRDEDGNSAGRFGAGMWDAQVGVAFISASGTRVGVQGLYAYQYIAEYDARAVLFNAALSQQIGRSWRLATGVFHWGWAEGFDREAENLPVEWRAGSSYEARWRRYGATLHLDLVRVADEGPEWRAGWELDWDRLLALRLGVAAGNERLGLSGGFRVRASAFVVEYGYGNVRRLGGNHVFSLGVFF